VPTLEAPLYVGASIGVALFPEHGDHVETLLMHADARMYAKKRSRKRDQGDGAGSAAPDTLSGGT
jgi:predicted signal transduction protein with EAL and GGDEF domain